MALDTFGKRIRALRMDKNLSQIDLRERMEKDAGVEIGETYISELERGTRMPSLKVAAAMAKVLDVTLDYLGLLIDDGEQSYKRTPAPVYFSDEADQVAEMIDSIRPEQRRALFTLVRDLAGNQVERSKQRAEKEDILDSVERELGADARGEVEQVILRYKGLLIKGK